jgi:uncharacterized membrane protein
MTKANEDQATPPAPLKPIVRRSETACNMPDARGAECESIYAAKENIMTQVDDDQTRAVAFLFALFMVLGAMGGAGYALTENLSWSATAGYSLIGCVMGVLAIFWLEAIGIIDISE